jgi:uncharacterized protein YdaU (DUF1376 family)
MKRNAINKRMPYMTFNFAEHGYRTSRLSLLERGLYDLIRTELWTVAPPALSREDLKLRLGIEKDSDEDQIIDRLISLGLLQEDPSGLLEDEVQAYEFSKAVQKSEINRRSAQKKWGNKQPVLSEDSDNGLKEGF